MSSPNRTTSRELRSLRSSEMYGPPSLDDGSVYINGLRRSARLNRKRGMLQMPVEPPTKKPKAIEEEEPIAPNPFPCKGQSFVCSTPKKGIERFPDFFSSDEDSDAEQLLKGVNLSEADVNGVTSSTEESSSYLVSSRLGYEGHIFSENR